MTKLLMTLCFAAAAVMPAFAAETEQVETFTAKLFTAKGTVEVQKKGAADWVKAKAPYMLEVGDQVRTGRKSKAEIYIKYGSKIRLGADTTFTLSKVAPEENAIEVARGKMNAWIRKFKGRGFSVRTPSAVCAVRGTVFGVEVADTGAATWDLFNGAIQVADTRTNYSVDLNPGQRLQVAAEPPAADAPPPAPEVIPANVEPPAEPAKIAEEKVEIKAEQVIIAAQAKQDAVAVAAEVAKEEPKQEPKEEVKEEAAAEKAAAEEAPVVVQEPATTVIPTSTVQEAEEVSGSNP